MRSSRRPSLVLATVASSMFANLSCGEDIQGPQGRSNRSALRVTLSGTVRSFDTGEPVEGVQVTVYRIMPADQPNVEVTSVQTDQHGRYRLSFSHPCDRTGFGATTFGLKLRKAGSPNLHPRATSERIWPLPDDICSRSDRTVDIQVMGSSE